LDVNDGDDDDDVWIAWHDCMHYEDLDVAYAVSVSITVIFFFSSLFFSFFYRLGAQVSVEW